MIPYGRQSIDESDIDAVVEVLRSSWLTQGPVVERFEQALAEYVGSEFAVAFSSGSAGLHGALAAGGLSAGDVVVCPSLTFAASANCALYLGADLQFVDIEKSSLNANPELVPINADALVAVHYAGLPMDLARLPHRPRVVVEDAAHALGATTDAGRVGNCALSDMTVFSFHPVKPITSAEGGAVTTNCREMAIRLRRFRNQGIDRSQVGPPWHYVIEEEGFNYRLSEVHAALGLSQLTRLDEFISKRNKIAKRYHELLGDFDVGLPPDSPEGDVHGRHLYPILVSNRARVFGRLRDAGIGVQVHYVPLHQQPRFASSDHPPLYVTNRLSEQLISLPLHPDLSLNDQDEVVRSLRDALVNQ